MFKVDSKEILTEDNYICVTVLSAGPIKIMRHIRSSELVGDTM